MPPEECLALCALSNVKITYIHGRPGHAWRLSVPDKSSITLQSAQYDDWAQAVLALLS